MEPSKVNRRRFLKYVSTGAVALGAASAYMFLVRPSMQAPATSTTTTTTYVHETTSTTFTNPVETYARSLGIPDDI
jgi:hypothetical protein